LPVDHCAVIDQIYPESNKVWKAFELCPLDKLKCVITAQDPYFYPKGQATGLAFECGIDISPSMDKFQEAYQDSFKYHFNTDILDGKLEYLAKQGVLLLNASLTVEAGKANSHKIYWERFTRKLLYELYKRDNNCIFIAIGKDAQDYMSHEMYKTANIIKLEHPAYAARQKRNWKYDNFFNKVNEMLVKQNKQEIEW
jgi:uracil-DNA glycosylase